MGSTARRVAALGALVLVTLAAFALPATAATDQAEDRAVTVAGSGLTHALVVGGVAFALMLSVAGAVLFYTAKGRRHGPSL
ncbi:hypothetical protein JHE00_15180 [Prauserella sp. ASG 168]|uniref:Uncharacterized protein n=1 Tax=Prauserella cavernicola TaxID=2800127 RepID=A0A934QSS9_9PSEU|nr:hypothetical protein [Prauserella cavernicola]